ncbi:hypothetical protein CLV84_4166 [Neolewinella xylanilytica]|uniref:PH (Pleckstrin Homology) domain-containing protein n=1 Tax=Neolewinella xylanilytica TaxID=1514080 RepID=A0A2S6I0L1_9BACT|nr:hypothetical protein [Neolewinella xylanilytica]PPK84396.1 hypothetical protein CLV84_4166 [Neolewinella xylanilytica]
MEPTQFSPALQDLYLTMAGCVAGIGVMVFLAVRANKQPSRDARQRVLLPMLAYFAGLLFLMALMGAFWTAMKYPVVAITGKVMTIDGEAYPVPSPQTMRLERVGRGINTDQTVLLLQTRDRRNWVFPENRYDVQAMYRELRAASN